MNFRPVKRLALAHGFWSFPWYFMAWMGALPMAVLMLFGTQVFINLFDVYHDKYDCKPSTKTSRLRKNHSLRFIANAFSYYIVVALAAKFSAWSSDDYLRMAFIGIVFSTVVMVAAAVWRRLFWY